MSKGEKEKNDALEQYINYLQILKNDNNMEAKINKIFENDNFFYDIDKLIATQESLEKFIDVIAEYKRNLIVEEINKWKNEINESYGIEIYEEADSYCISWAVKCKNTGAGDCYLFIDVTGPFENYDLIHCIFRVEDEDLRFYSNQTINLIRKVLRDNCRGGFNVHTDTYECRWSINKTNMELAKKTFFEVLNVIKKLEKK